MNEKFAIFLTHPINGEQAASKENKQKMKQTNRGEEPESFKTSNLFHQVKGFSGSNMSLCLA